MMARAKYQVLVIPYYIKESSVQYCVFQRKDSNIWQFIAGGGEETDGTIFDTAKREAYEEANISRNERFTQLETMCSISTEHFNEARKNWGETCLVIPEYAFAVQVSHQDLLLSDEHTTYTWLDYETASECLKYDSNKVALWELDNKIRLGLLD